MQGRKPLQSVRQFWKNREHVLWVTSFVPGSPLISPRYTGGDHTRRPNDGGVTSPARGLWGRPWGRAKMTRCPRCRSTFPAAVGLLSHGEMSLCIVTDWTHSAWHRGPRKVKGQNSAHAGRPLRITKEMKTCIPEKSHHPPACFTQSVHA